MRKVWIEAALNGAWTRALQPGIPERWKRSSPRVSPAHAPAPRSCTRMPIRSGPQTFDWQVYARIIEGIRDESTCRSIRPSRSTPPTSMAPFTRGPTAAVRPYRGAGRTRPARIRGHRPRQRQFHLTATTSGAKPAGTYLNPEAHVRHALAFAARQGLHPGFRDLRAGLHPRRRRARPRGRHEDSDLSLHVLEEFAFGFPPGPTRSPPIWRCWRRKQPARRG